MEFHWWFSKVHVVSNMWIFLLTTLIFVTSICSSLELNYKHFLVINYVFEHIENHYENLIQRHWHTKGRTLFNFLSRIRTYIYKLKTITTLKSSNNSYHHYQTSQKHVPLCTVSHIGILPYNFLFSPSIFSPSIFSLPSSNMVKLVDSKRYNNPILHTL